LNILQGYFSQIFDVLIDGVGPELIFSLDDALADMQKSFLNVT